MAASPQSLLASYATFKALYNSPKYASPYQILTEFIKYIITTKKIYCFTVVEIKKYLEDEFGFVQPYEVIKTAMKSIPEIHLNYGKYSVPSTAINMNAFFDNQIKKAEETNNDLIEKLLEFAQKKGTNIEKKKLSEEFVAFLLDEDGDQLYREIIGAFIIANGANETVKQQMMEIREGSIIFSGLSYNISDYGNMRDPLTLFLDTEIIFDIMGLNGELYQELAMDFYNLVKEANKNKKIISLCYFSEIKKDIERYFSRAEQTVDGKRDLLQRPALQAIIQGCNSISDVKDKKADFYWKLQHSFDIQLDDKINYYTKQDEMFELETEEINGLSLDESHEEIKFCSKINKLRKGSESRDYFTCKFLFITKTTKVLEINNSLIEKQRTLNHHSKCIDYAISFSHITNLFWCKLNCGFAKQNFPHNIDVVTKARVVLSGYITQGVNSAYSEIRKEYEAGKISQEITISRIIALRNKPSLPEEITENNLDDSLSFDSNYLNQIAESNAKKDLKISEQNKTIEELTKIIQGYIDKQEALKYKKRRIKSLFFFILRITWKAFLYFCLIISIYFLSLYLFHTDLPGFLAILAFITSSFKKAKQIFQRDYIRYKNSIQDNKKET